MLHVRSVSLLATALTLALVFASPSASQPAGRPFTDPATWNEWLLPLGDYPVTQPQAASCWLFVREVGVGEPLVMLHGGWGGEMESLRGWMPLAAGDMHRLVFYDQRGSLRSKCDALPTVADHVADLERLRAALGVEKISILGHSMGGWLAQAYAAEHPDRVAGLILVDPTPAVSGLPGRTEETRWERPAVLAELERLGLALDRRPADTFQEWSINHRIIFASISLHDVTRWREVPVPWFYATEAAESASSSMPEEWDFTGDLAALPVPILVVAGDDDYIPIESQRAWVSRVPNARIVEIADAGHFSWIDRPDAVLSAVEAYLEEVSRP